MNEPLRKGEAAPRSPAEPPTVVVNAAPVGEVKAILRSVDAENQLRTALAALPRVTLQVLSGKLSDNLANIIADPRPTALLVDIDLGDPLELLSLRKLVGRDLVGVPVVVTSSTAAIEDLRQLMRLNITDYLTQPFVAADVAIAISSALRKAQAMGGRGRNNCKVFSLVRRSGGMGATFVAIQTALALLGGGQKGSRPRVCLIDLDFESAVSAIYLDIEANLDLVQIARAPERLDAPLFQSMVSHHRSGLDILALPAMPIELELITPESVSKLLDVACEQYDFLVVDLSPAWTRWTIDVLSGSDVVLLVLQLSVAAVKQARGLIDKMVAEGFAQSRIYLVVNRYRRKLWGSGVRVSSAEDALGRKVDFLIADDPDLVTSALDHGQLLSEVKSGSAIEKQTRDMVDRLLARLSSSALPASAVGGDRRSNRN